MFNLSPQISLFMVWTVVIKAYIMNSDILPLFLGKPVFTLYLIGSYKLVYLWHGQWWTEAHMTKF